MKFIVYAVCALSLAGTFAAWSLTKRIHVRKGSAIVLFLVHFAICAMDAVTLRFYQQAYPADLVHGALLKFAASLPWQRTLPSISVHRPVSFCLAYATFSLISPL